MFLSATSKGSGIQQALEWLRQESKGRFITTGTLAMVAGVPNVGKSTFINAVASAARPNGSKRRNSGDRAEGGGATWVSGGGGSAKHLAKVGARPGVTRTLSSVLVCEAPLVRLLDTPGILVPKIENVEIGLRLALTGAVRDEVVGEDMLVAYLVDCLGRVKGGSLLEALPHNLLAAHGGFDDDDGSRGGGGSPISSLEDVVALVERASGAAGKGSEEERTRIACRFVLAQFRAGKLGRFTLDDPSTAAPLAAAATETHETSSRPASSSIHADQFKNTGPARNGKSAPAPASSLLYRPSDIF
jgi:ribosome biogenesis GTPase A